MGQLNLMNLGSKIAYHGVYSDVSKQQRAEEQVPSFSNWKNFPGIACLLPFLRCGIGLFPTFYYDLQAQLIQAH